MIKIVGTNIQRNEIVSRCRLFCLVGVLLSCTFSLGAQIMILPRVGIDKTKSINHPGNYTVMLMEEWHKLNPHVGLEVRYYATPNFAIGAESIYSKVRRETQSWTFIPITEVDYSVLKVNFKTNYLLFERVHIFFGLGMEQHRNLYLEYNNELWDRHYDEKVYNKFMCLTIGGNYQFEYAVLEFGYSYSQGDTKALSLISESHSIFMNVAYPITWDVSWGSSRALQCPSFL